MAPTLTLNSFTLPPISMDPDRGPIPLQEKWTSRTPSSLRFSAVHPYRPPRLPAPSSRLAGVLGHDPTVERPKRGAFDFCRAREAKAGSRLSARVGHPALRYPPLWHRRNVGAEKQRFATRTRARAHTHKYIYIYIDIYLYIHTWRCPNRPGEWAQEWVVPNSHSIIQ